MICLIWIYTVCKSLLLLPVAVKELKRQANFVADNILFFLIFFSKKISSDILCELSA